MNIQQNLWFLLPETIIIFTIVVVVLAELILPEKNKHQTGWLAATGLVGSFLITLVLYRGDIAFEYFKKMIVFDSWSLFFKLFFEATGFIIIILSLNSKETRERNQGEYYALLLSVVLGLMFMASATDLIMILLAMEMVGVLSYILVGFNKLDPRSSEAALKYLIYGATATAVMLFGMSYLYGLTGSTNIYTIAQYIHHGENAFTITVIVLFIIVGFGYKIAVVPFHMWCPDVYEGAPTPITAFLSVGPKAAGFALILRFFFTLFTHTTSNGAIELIGNFKWPELIAIISVFTMTIGNLSAITQSNVKRMLAYSSIAHAGYMMMGFVVFDKAGLKAILFYLVAYLFMNAGAFLIVAAIRDGIGSEEIEDYKGLGQKMMFAPVMLSICLFSLTGIPPFSGFVGKVYLLLAVLNKGWFLLATIAIINTVISLYYYARVAKAMFLDVTPQIKPDETVALTPLLIIGSLVTAIPTVILGIYWSPLINFAQKSVNMLI